MILTSLLLSLATPVAVHVDVVDDLLAAGQAKLIAGDARGALEQFQQANGHTGGALRTEVWVLRAEMESGRKNDAMARIEEIEGKSDVPAHVSDYLRGTFSYLTAQELITGGGRGGNAGFHLEDAKSFLASALEAAPDDYPDAWRNLAASARGTGDLETAGSAVREALKRLPQDPATNALAAQVLVAQGVAGINSGDEAQAEAGRALVREGVERATAAARLYGTDRKDAARIAEAHLQRAVGALWLEDKEAAGEAYADAMEWDPTQVDYGTLWGSLQDEENRPVPFVAALSDGAARFEKRWGKSTQSDASLLWWLGYGEYALARYADAEKHFLAAVAKWPAYVNSWWYAGLARYFQQDYPGAVELWRRNWAVDPANLVASVNGDATLHDSILAFVEGKLMEAGNPNDASFVAQVRAGARPEDDKVWNNLGLFCRDAGDALRRAGKETDEHRTVEQYYELAWEAYQKAMELEPGKPYYINDGAVILHYCLDREHQRALDMYAEATEIAERMLAQGGLDKDEKGLVEIALRDSKNNRERLVRLLERRKKEAEEKKKGGDGGDGGGV